jgi:hypothetical protein
MMPVHALLSTRWVVLLILVVGFGLLDVASFGNAVPQERVAPQFLTMEMQQSRPNLPATRHAPVPSRKVSTLTSPPTNPIASPRSFARGNPLWDIPLASLTVTRTRPIFSRTRRPPMIAAPPTVRPKPAAQPKGPQLILVGTIAGDHEGIAIFLDETTKGVVRLTTGQTHAGWILQQVKVRKATLKKGHQTVVLALQLPSAKIKPSVIKR